MCTKRKDLVQAMVKFATTTAKGEVSLEVLSGSVRTIATLLCGHGRVRSERTSLPSNGRSY